MRLIQSLAALYVVVVLWIIQEDVTKLRAWSRELSEKEQVLLDRQRDISRDLNRLVSEVQGLRAARVQAPKPTYRPLGTIGASGLGDVWMPGDNLGQVLARRARLARAMEVR